MMPEQRRDEKNTDQIAMASIEAGEKSDGRKNIEKFIGFRKARRYGFAIDGWLVLDKPIGLRSTAAVSRVQSLLRARKCGHAGTLDPAAEGLLPLALGTATKTVAYAMDSTKNYDITVRWGERSTTDDGEGEIEVTSDKRPCREDIESILGKFIGTIEQRPPTFSALRIDGKRAYALAREGKKVSLAARPVQIISLKLLEIINQDLARFSVDAGKGTYMRALARDLGEALGCYGRLHSLRRKRVGAFYEKHAISLDALEKIVHSEEQQSQTREDILSRLGGMLLPVESVLNEMPKLALDHNEQRKFRQGQSLLFVGGEQEERVAHIKSKQYVAVFSSYPLPKLLGIGSLHNGFFKAVRLFVQPSSSQKYLATHAIRKQRKNLQRHRTKNRSFTDNTINR